MMRSAGLLALGILFASLPSRSPMNLLRCLDVNGYGVTKRNMDTLVLSTRDAGIAKYNAQTSLQMIRVRDAVERSISSFRCRIVSRRGG